ncbi:MAG: hypothetical protein HYV09_10370 [Deltaproteobacteria bacterium]|nr:hypothetical protein [Deltaproteobacteria bacterium]
MRALVRGMTRSTRLVPFAVAALTVALAACIIGPKQDDPSSATVGSGPDASFADTGEYTDPAAASDAAGDGARADDIGSSDMTDASSDAQDAKGDADAQDALGDAHDALGDALGDAPDAD